MTLRARAATFALLLPLACQMQPAVEAPETTEIVARVDGVEIDVAELDDFIKEQLFREKTRNRTPALLYDAREDALGQLVREKILDAEAARRGLAVEELVEREAAALGPVGDAEIAAFYEENRERVGERSLEELSDTIRAYLESRRNQDAIEAIEARAEVVRFLEPPRFQVAAGGPAMGPPDARITIVEFSDFQCPFCQRASAVVKAVRERYPGDVRLVYKQFPLETIHPQARAAAEASLCAADQDRFWEYHDKLFENSKQLAEEDLVRYAGELELDPKRFEQCVADRAYRVQVDEDMELGRELGVSGTPAFFVNGIMLSGAKPLESFVEVIEAELERLGQAESS